jgi:hypothetical protein
MAVRRICPHKRYDTNPPEPDVGLFGWTFECHECGAVTNDAEEYEDIDDVWGVAYRRIEPIWPPEASHDD